MSGFKKKQLTPKGNILKAFISFWNWIKGNKTERNVHQDIAEAMRGTESEAIWEHMNNETVKRYNDHRRKRLWSIPSYLSPFIALGFLFYTYTLDGSSASIFFLYILPFALFFSAFLGVSFAKSNDDATKRQVTGVFIFSFGLINLLHFSTYIDDALGGGFFADLITSSLGIGLILSMIFFSKPSKF
jgi:hypothetical protein